MVQKLFERPACTHSNLEHRHPGAACHTLPTAYIKQSHGTCTACNIIRTNSQLFKPFIAIPPAYIHGPTVTGSAHPCQQPWPAERTDAGRDDLGCL